MHYNKYKSVNTMFHCQFSYYKSACTCTFSCLKWVAPGFTGSKRTRIRNQTVSTVKPPNCTLHLSMSQKLHRYGTIMPDTIDFTYFAAVMEDEDIIVDMIRIEEELYDYEQQFDNVKTKLERLQKSFDEITQASIFNVVPKLRFMIEQATVDCLSG